LTRQVLNKTAKEFIEEQVILEAKRLLAQGSRPIKEIAYELGFSEPTNMVKFFKKHTHTTPAAFRNRFHPSD
jgi:AraC family transcriptional activator of pobA